MKNVASRGPLFSSGGSNGVEGFEYGYSLFSFDIFSVYFYFKVPMVEHGSDACPMVVCSISVRFKLSPLLAPLLMEEEISLRGLIRYWCASGGM